MFWAQFAYFRADSNIAFGFGFGAPSRVTLMEAYRHRAQYEPKINVIANEVVTIFIVFHSAPIFSAPLMAIRNQIVLM